MMAAWCSHSALAPGLPFTVYGYVHDQSGAPVSGAYVTVQSPLESRTSISDSQGKYWVTISINGVGDAIKVTASKDGAQAGASGTVPSGSSSLRLDVSIRSAATTTSTTIPPTTTKASSTTSRRSSTTSIHVTSHTSTTAAGGTGRTTVSTTSTQVNATNMSIITQWNTTTFIVTTTFMYTTTETIYQIRYQTSSITTTRVETQPQSLSTMVFSAETGGTVSTSDEAFRITIVSNIKVDDLVYDRDLNRLTMSVRESQGSPALFEIGVPKELIADPMDVVIEIDGTSFGSKLADSSDEYFLGFWLPPGQSVLSISFGSKVSQSHTGMVQGASLAEGTLLIPSVLVGLFVLAILLSLSRPVHRRT